MNHHWKRIVSLLLAAALIFALAIPGFAAREEDEEQPSGISVTWEKIDAAPRAVPETVPSQERTPAFGPNESVRVSIVLEKPSVLEADYSTEGLADNQKALNYRGSVKRDQGKVAARIATQALDGQTLDVVWNLTLVANVISANVPYGRIDRIRNVDGVKDVFLEMRYEPASAIRETDSPNMGVAAEMTGGSNAWAAGYTGAGSKVAVLDTGLDTDHELFQADALEYALEQDGLDVTLLTAADTAGVWEQLHASEFIDSAADTYLNSKVPFAVNYVDRDLDVTHDNDNQGEHGSHVAGIAAANRFVSTDAGFVPSLKEVVTQGEAPDAQIIVMKVFGKGGGAYDSDYMAAIEDAIVLGADSVNLSLGSAAAGFVTSDGYQKIMENLTESDTVVVMSMGNNYKWTSFANQDWPYLYSDGVNYMTGGSPGSFTNSLTVASVENDGNTGIYLEAFDRLIFFTETFYNNGPIASIPGTYEFVYLDNYGADVDENDNYTVNYFDGMDLTGKIAICNRGVSSFYVKCNAAVEAGAEAVIIADNQAGTNYMNLTGYQYDKPAVCISVADAAFLKANAEGVTDGGDEVLYYTGEITVSDRIGSHFNGSDYYTMSEFSSWGGPGDLSLKPEITAPGGNIYSVNGAEEGGKGYETLSGTSMAAPQITGFAAVLAQYVRENGLAEKTGLTPRTLINSLLMSTAEPLLQDGEFGVGYYSVLKQGAGLVQIGAALSADSYVLMNADATPSYADGKVKVELGDDPGRAGEYAFSFTLNNLTEEELYYDLSADFFTQGIVFYYALDGENIAVDANGDPVLATYLYDETALLSSSLSWTVDGEEYAPEETVKDPNGDGVLTPADAEAILDYVVNSVALVNEDDGDFDEDGDIDTYDAYLALQGVSQASVVVPADGSVEIGVNVVLNDIADYDDCGAYVEGFVYAVEKTTEEGAVGTTHSIPVIGYYGSWTEPDMTDVGDYVSLSLTGEEPRVPYLNGVLQQRGIDARLLETFTRKFSWYSETISMAGNVFGSEDGYAPERNAINAFDTITGASYTLVRNAASGLFTITNADTGETLLQAETGPLYASFYNLDQMRWFNTTGSTRVDYVPGEAVEEGDTLELSLVFAPEYYLQDDGTIDWGSVYEDAGMTLQVVVDNTAPVIESVSADEENLTIAVSDNRYTAIVNLWNEAGWLDLNNGEPLDMLGADPEEEEGAGRTIQIPLGTEEGQLDLSAEGNRHLMVEVCDYAGNYAAYKLNLNTEEMEGGIRSLTVTPESAKTIPTGTVLFSAAAQPWGVSDEVTWSSSDESVAVVDEYGFATGVGEGVVTITAASVENPQITASAELTVEYFEKKYNALIMDAEGATWFTAFSTKDVTMGNPVYDRLAPADVELTSASYDAYGEVLYAASLTEGFGSQLYTVDPATFELTPVGNESMVAFLDLTPAPLVWPTVNSNEAATMVSCYGSSIVGVDTVTGQFSSSLDMSEYIEGSFLVGLAYESSDSFYGLDDYYYLVDNLGNLYHLDLWYTEFYGLWPLCQKIGTIGDSVEYDHYNSLFFDGEDLLWARFNNTDEPVELIAVDDINDIYHLGFFGESDWPVSGLFLLENGPAPDTGNRISFAAEKANISEMSSVSLSDEVTLVRRVEYVKGGLHAVTGRGFAGDPIQAITIDEPEDADDATITLMSDDVTTNGLYTVEYDAEKLELQSAQSKVAAYSRINQDEEGKVVFGFATLDEITADDELLVLTFTKKEGCGETEITVTTDELNDTNPGTEETITVGKYTWSEPEWTWSEDYSSATAVFTAVEDETVTVEIEAAVASETTDATCEEAGKTVYSAAAEFEGETYTDTKEAAIEALGHSWGEPEWTWAEDCGSATARFTCANDETHTKSAEATVASKEFAPTDEEDAYTLYSASVEFEGKTYTQEKKVRESDDEPFDESDDEPADEPAKEEPAEEEPAEELVLPFTDVNVGDWFYDDVFETWKAGLIKGTSDTTFCPADNVTRAQIVTILYRLDGSHKSSVPVKFLDVAKDAYYYDAVAWASANGIVLGMSETEFAPNLDITREQFTAIMFRYARYRGNTDEPAGALSGFSDADAVSSWATDAMSWSFGKGILKGMGDGKIDPQGTTTRAQAAAFFHRLMNVLG